MVVCFVVTPKRFSSYLVLLSLLVGAGCAGDDDPKVDAASRLQVIFDYSPTLSDANALLYLASNPLVELLAVTLPGTGEADCEPGVRATRALLTLAGGDDVAVGCGRNDPLKGDRDWPTEWLQEVDSWNELGLLPSVVDEPLLDAEQLLADTLDAATAPVTLIAVGPLTNLGAVLGDRPELAAKVARVVIMGGAVTVAGNVEASPAAEWNIYIDPEAGRRVIAAGVPVTLVALDATNYLPWTDRLLVRVRALDTTTAKTVNQLATARDTTDGIYLWDELAAMTAVDPSLVTVEAMTVRIDDDGAVVRDPAGFPIEVAIAADTAAATQTFLDALNGGPVSAMALTAAELEYFIAIGGINSDVAAAAGNPWSGLGSPAADPRVLVEEFVSSFLDSLVVLANNLREVDPPPTLVKAHDEYVESLDTIVSKRSDLIAAIAESDGANVEEVFADVESLDAFRYFEGAGEKCQTLVTYSFLRDGPRPCDLG